jgi:poly(glycerol-phosphate) alpha-glucosyltransferase
MTVLEAWAAGTPTVMTAACHLPEGFAAGAAIAAEPNVESLARGLSEMLSATDSQRVAMGARGRQLVAERFTWQKDAAEMHAVYRWLVGGGAPPACVITK